jgi:hypothetical protein
VQTLRTSAHSYAGAEAAAAASLRSASSMPGILEDLLQLAEPLYQWFLTWPASIQGFVNVTRTLQGAFLLLLFALLPIVLLLLPLLTTLGL